MIAVLVITGLALAIGAMLSVIHHHTGNNTETLSDSINRLLPQTQCAQCGYPGCRPYADAIAADEAPINQCPPGGTHTIEQLAGLLGREVIPLNSTFGETKPDAVAFIDEMTCIGCTLCIHACPVDAILGAGKFMHTVIASECTGCELCLPPCPVDCITLLPVTRSVATS